MIGNYRIKIIETVDTMHSNYSIVSEQSVDGIYRIKIMESIIRSLNSFIRQDIE